MEREKFLQRIKTYILYATISLLVVGGFISIFMIFFGPTNTLLQVLGTLLILYLMTLLSANNFTRMDSVEETTKVCSIVALIVNLFWAVPWILIVWGCFGDNYALVDAVWRFVWTALVVSIYCTLLAQQLPYYMKLPKGIQRLQSTIPLFLITYIFIDVLVYIWTPSMSSSAQLLWKFICAEWILIILQWAVSEILLRNQRKQMNTMQMPNPNNQGQQISQNQSQLNRQNEQPVAEHHGQPNPSHNQESQQKSEQTHHDLQTHQKSHDQSRKAEESSHNSDHNHESKDDKDMKRYVPDEDDSEEE